MFERILMYVSLAGAATLSLAFFVVWMHERGMRPLGSAVSRFRRLPWLGRVVVVLFAAHMFAFGSGKGDGGNSPNGGSGGGSLRGNAQPAAFDPGFTPEEIEVGYALWRVGTNETWSFEAPQGAGEVSSWTKRGAAEDWIGIDASSLGFACEGEPAYMTSSGEVALGDVVYSAFGRAASVFPWDNRHLVSAGGEGSGAWRMNTYWDSFVGCWVNGLVERSTNAPASVQLELTRDGAALFLYDLSRVGADASNCTASVARGDASISLPLSPDVTSVSFYRLLPLDLVVQDRDGDGLSTSDEVKIYHTDPGLADTDGDGIPDGVEVLNGSDPVARSVPSEEILARVAASSTNELYQAAAVVEPDSLSAVRLWDGFAADIGTSATNLLFERALDLGSVNGWQHFFLSSSPDGAGDWDLRGVELEWDDGCGSSGTVRASPAGDSLYLPLTNMSGSVTIRLRATDGVVRAAKPMYLLSYSPVVTFAGCTPVLDQAGNKIALVAIRDADNPISVSFDRSLRPSSGSLNEGESRLPGLEDIEMLSGGKLRFSGSAEGGALEILGTGESFLPSTGLGSGATAVMGTNGNAIVLLDPSVSFGDNHSYGGYSLLYDEGADTYAVTNRYPLEGKCIWRSWLIDVSGAASCSCEPSVTSGADYLDYITSSISRMGETAYGCVYVYGQLVWQGTTLHKTLTSREEHIADDSELLEALGECSPCELDCEDGMCDAVDGPTLGSLRFRVSLGAPRLGQHSGFVWLAAEGPVALSPLSFNATIRADAQVSVSTNGSSVTYSCGDARGRDVVLDPIPSGVRATVRTHATGALDNMWELENVGGAASAIRIRQISRIGNIMRDATYSCDGGMWTELDNISGVRETVSRVDALNTPGVGRLTETRTQLDPCSNLVSSTVTEYSLVGIGANAVLRQTHWTQDTGSTTLWRSATYWDDAAHRGRHGKPRLVWGNSLAWNYHDYDDNGFETLLVEQRNGSSVPQAFPWVDGGVLHGTAGLSNAWVTVSDYTPFAGDDADPEDAGRARCETRYAVRGGEALCIGRKWHRYTHVVHGGMPAVKCETWRASGPAAGMADASNAYSWEVSLSETGQGVPLVLRGRLADSLDENGIRRTHLFSVVGGTVREEVRRSFGASAYPTYEVIERDSSYGTTLREATCLEDGDTVIAEETSVYDEKNRMRSRTFSDGTSLTNAYSCCRLLWSEDRLGRRTLRSAVTGRDMLYYADEDVWLRDVSTNGKHRVTQHFMDGFGRETNVVVYVAAAAGEATNSIASAGCETSRTSVSYPYGGSDHVVTVDGRGKRTVSVNSEYADRASSLERVFADGAEECSVETLTTRIRGGASCVARTWDGKWRREWTLDDYDSNGCLVSYEITESSDCGVVTNRVARHDFLGRKVLVETPLGSTATTYLGSSGLAGTTTVSAGGEPRTTSALYNERRERVGSVCDGVTSLAEIDYSEDGEGVWWRVERETVLGSATNSVSETRTMLTGLGGGGPVSRVVRTSADGVVSDMCESLGAGPCARVGTVSNSVSGVTTRSSVGGLVVETAGAGGSRVLSYDALGRNVLVSRPGGVRESAYEYNPAGDVVAVHSYTNADAFSSALFGYDSFGRRVYTEDALGGAVTTRYDAVGNVVEISGATTPVRYEYDTSGRCTSLSTTRNGIIWDMTSFTYNPRTGRCTAKYYADGAQEAHSYTADGLLCEEVNQSGSWVRRAYDASRRVSALQSSDGKADASLSYDEFGRMSAASNAAAVYAYSRACGGVATNEAIAVGTNAAVYVRALDQYGRVCGRGFSGGLWQAVEYDGRGRVSAVSNDAASVRYSYSSEGLDIGCVVALPGGVTVSRQVARDAFRPERVIAVTNLVNGVAVEGFEYSYDAAGRVARCNGIAFERDVRGQLTGACIESGGSSGAGFAYAYDLAGNVASLARGTNELACVANSLNQYVYFGDNLVSADLDGCVSQVGSVAYGYDSALRLDSVSTGEVQVASYAYDAFGRRVSKTAGDSSTVFFYDGLSLVRETRTSGDGPADVCDYCWGRDASGTLCGAGGVGGLVCVVRNGAVYVPLYDAFGNVTAYVDSTGSVVAEYSYAPFGGSVSASGAMAGEFRYRYSTKYHDEDSGLVMYECRCYSPELASWMTRDPIGESGGVNLYAFCGNDPVGRFDPLGMFVVIPPHIYEPVGTWISVAELYFRATMNWEFAATLLELSLKDFDGSLPVVFGEGSVAANEIRDSEEYKRDVCRLLRSLPAGKSFVQERSSVEFLSGDLYAAAKRARIEYSGYVCRPIAGADRTSLNVTVSDTYNFEWWDISDTGKELSMEAILTTAGNNMAHLDQIRGVIKPFDWEVKFRESRRWQR